MGIGGAAYFDHVTQEYSFNPLGRGMGIGGKSLQRCSGCRVVSIRLDAAWVLGGIISVGYCCPGPGFNPLGRGMGIGGM